MDPAERLADLLALLLYTPRPLTVDEIVGQVEGYPDARESARVQFERDKAALRDDGVAIEESPGGGYRIDLAAWELPDLGLTAEESLALNLAVSAVRLEGADATTALWKLGLTADPTPPLVELPSVPALVDLQSAVAAGATVAFSYGGIERVVEPYGLLTREGWWYVAGFDRVRDALRVFRLDRIDHDGRVVAGRPGEVAVPDGFDIEAALPDDAFALGSGAAVDAVVLVDALVAPRVVADLGDERVVERRTDGSVVVSLPVTHEPGFVSWLFGFLDHAAVLSPPSLVDMVVARLRAVAGSPTDQA